MVVIVGWVVHDGVEHFCRDLTLYGRKKFLIRTKFPLFLIGQSIIAHILFLPRPRGSGKGISHG